MSLVQFCLVCVNVCAAARRTVHIYGRCAHNQLMCKCVYQNRREIWAMAVLNVRMKTDIGQGWLACVPRLSVASSSESLVTVMNALGDIPTHALHCSHYY